MNDITVMWGGGVGPQSSVVPDVRALFNNCITSYVHFNMILFPPPLWSNVYTNCKWCTLKCPMLQPEWHNKSWVTHGATCNHASLCVRRGNDTFSPSLSPVSKTLSIDLGMFPYSDAIVHHCDRFDGKQDQKNYILLLLHNLAFWTNVCQWQTNLT